jgi:chitinase
VVVTANPDTLAEATETFTVELSNASTGINIDKAVGVGTILNDDGPPANVSVNDVTVSEGAGTGHFTVSLEKAVPAVVSVSYSMKNGTATDGSDFGGSSGVVTWGPNSTTPQTIDFTVNQDTTYEADETFTVELSNPINAVLAKGTGTATITNDDAPPVVSITPTLAVSEGNTGTTKATLDVTLSAASGLPAQVNFASAAGTATPGTDYTVDPNNTLVFAPGETSKQIQLSVNGDTLYEAGETFTVTLSAPQGATLGGATGTVTITNDDAAPMVHIDGTSVIEPATSGKKTPASFPVRLSQVSGKDVTVTFNTTNGTATSGSGDYTKVTNGTVIIPKGTLASAAVVDVLGDGVAESDETFTVTLSSPVDATLDPSGTTATGVIKDNTPGGPPQFSITPAVTVKEGNTTASAVLTLSLTPAQAGDVTVQYATADGTAKAPGDYTAVLPTTVKFNAGETVKTVSVNIVGDTIDEADENFSVKLSNPSAGTISQDTGTVTIRDDDGPAISVADLSVIEGNSGTKTAAFAVSLSAASPQAVSVTYGTSDGTASAPADYTAASGTLTFAPGETFKTVNVNVVGDTIDEADEDFTLGLSSPVNATIARAQGRAVIVDDDQPTVTVAGSSPSATPCSRVRPGPSG